MFRTITSLLCVAVLLYLKPQAVHPSPQDSGPASPPPASSIELTPSLKLLARLYQYEQLRKLNIVNFIAHQLYGSIDLKRDRSLRLTLPASFVNSSNQQPRPDHVDDRNLAQWRKLLNIFSKINVTHVLINFLNSKNETGRYVIPDLKNLVDFIENDGDELLNETSINIIDITIRRPALETVSILVGYGIVIVVSLVGNLLVCRVIYTTPKLKTTTNILIFSLTVSDILTAIFNIPFNCARILLNSWPFPDWCCILMPTLQVASVYVSTFTMTAIGLHRYGSLRMAEELLDERKRQEKQKKTLYMSNNNQEQSISSAYSSSSFPSVLTSNLNPASLISSYTSKTKLSIMLITIWIVSVLLALPHSMFNRVVAGWYHYGTLYARRCRAVYPVSVQHFMPLLLSISATLTQFLIPLSITGILYTRVARIIQHQGRLAIHACDELKRRMCEAKRRRIMMLILVVASFTLCWLPLTCYHLLTDLHLIEFHYNMFHALHLLAMSSICWNPIIYCWMNASFRQQVTKYFSSINCKRCLLQLSCIHRFIQRAQSSIHERRRSSPNSLLLVRQQMFEIKTMREDGANDDVSCCETKVDQLTPVTPSRAIDSLGVSPLQY